MWIKKAFNILQITKTTNKRKIALAYKKLLLFQSDKQVLLYQIPSGALSTSNTPAEKTVEEEKEYLKFQQAYETAIAYATKREEKERISKDTEDFEDTEISEKEEQISTQSKHIMADEVPAPPDYINFIYKDIITDRKSVV